MYCEKLENFADFNKESKKQLNLTMNEKKYKKLFNAYWDQTTFYGGHHDKMVYCDSIINKGRNNKLGCVDTDALMKILNETTKRNYIE